MWTIIVTGFIFIGGVILSLVKSSSRREEVAIRHREELLARKNNNFFDIENKTSDKNEPPSAG